MRFIIISIWLHILGAGLLLLWLTPVDPPPPPLPIKIRLAPIDIDPQATTYIPLESCPNEPHNITE